MRFGHEEERKIAVEEVDHDAPPRARVTPEFERKRDYLAGSWPARRRRIRRRRRVNELGTG